MLALVVPALVAFFASLGLVPVCRAVARRLGCVAEAREDRWHKSATPLLGGVAIAGVVFAVYPFFGSVRDVPALFVSAALMFAVGLVDDLITLKPQTKFVAAIVAASVLVFFGYRLAWTDWSALDVLLTMVWIVGVTNAVNLLDNMDGLAAGVSLIAVCALLGAFVLDGGVQPRVVYLAVLLGATAGFLVYNFHPASIFMGDGGSLFLGLNLAALTLGVPGAGGSAGLLSILVGPLLVLLVPILDTTLVTVSRILSGRSAARGGRDHTSHRLVAIGLSERGAVAVLWVLAVLGGLLAVAMRELQTDWPGILAGLFLLATAIFTVYLANVRVYRDASDRPIVSGPMTPFVAELMYKRRVAEVLLDLCLVTLAYYAAYRLRFESRALATYRQNFLDSLPIIVAVQMLALFSLGAYRGGAWKYFGLMDGVAFGKAVLLGTVTSVSLIVYVYRFENYSRGVFVIYAALLMLLLCGSRASFRLIHEFAFRPRPGGQRLVIYGTGDGAATAVRDLLSSTDEGCRMLGFIDDDPAMAMARMQEYPVLGDYPMLVSLISNGGVDSVVITTPAIDVERLEGLRTLCARHHVSLSRLHVALNRLGAAS